MAQLVEQSLPIPEVRGSNPVIGNILYGTFTVNYIEKTKIKIKRPGMDQFFLKNTHLIINIKYRKHLHPEIRSKVLTCWGN